MAERDSNRFFGILGWCLVFLSTLPLFVVNQSTCTQGSEDTWLASTVLSLSMLLVGSVMCICIPATHKIVTFINVILIPLLIASVWVCMKYMMAVSINGQHLCTVATGEAGFDVYPRSWWAAYWAPVHVIVLMVVAILVINQMIKSGGDGNAS